MEQHRYLVGLLWVPKKRAEDLVLKFTDQSKFNVYFKDIKEHTLKPPTSFQLNEFTWSFHEIVVTYGTPNYGEVNPTLFNIVTFPFLFGIMFGDIGHGGILLMLAIYLCLRNERELSGILKPLAKIKYMLLLMGIFATYCGFIYNDLMSLPLNLFGSCYVSRPGKSGLIEATLTKDCVYPFGLDPKWYVGHNELAYFNSYKMKLAVILGILQMSLGVTLKGLNAALASSGLDFFCEFLPQLFFLLALFGTMDAFIVSKWLTDYSGREKEAPSVITQMINNVLKGGEVHGSALLGAG